MIKKTKLDQSHLYSQQKYDFLGVIFVNQQHISHLNVKITVGQKVKGAYKSTKEKKRDDLRWFYIRDDF